MWQWPGDSGDVKLDPQLGKRGRFGQVALFGVRSFALLEFEEMLRTESELVWVHRRTPEYMLVVVPSETFCEFDVV